MVIWEKYERYNFVEVPFDGDLKVVMLETIEKCKDITEGVNLLRMAAGPDYKPIQRKKGIDKQQQLCH